MARARGIRTLAKQTTGRTKSLGVPGINGRISVPTKSLQSSDFRAVSNAR